MNTSRSKTNWILDAVLFFVFIASFQLDQTGLAVHQWLGTAVAAIGGLHLWRHRDWVISVTRRLLGSTSLQARLYYWIDAALFAGLGFVAISGLVISTWFSLSLSNYNLWRSLHITISVMTLPVLVLKIGLHWRWIIQVGQKHIFRRNRLADRPTVAVAQPAHMSRREFLKLMGLVGTAATVAAPGALRSDPTSLTGESPRPRQCSLPGHQFLNLRLDPTPATAAAQKASTALPPATASAIRIATRTTCAIMVSAPEYIRKKVRKK